MSTGILPFTAMKKCPKITTFCQFLSTNPKIAKALYNFGNVAKSWRIWSHFPAPYLNMMSFLLAII